MEEENADIENRLKSIEEKVDFIFSYFEQMIKVTNSIINMIK